MYPSFVIFTMVLEAQSVRAKQELLIQSSHSEYFSLSVSNRGEKAQFKKSY
jgi:hypothetical protein